MHSQVRPDHPTKDLTKIRIPHCAPSERPPHRLHSPCAHPTTGAQHTVGQGHSPVSDHKAAARLHGESHGSSHPLTRLDRKPKRSTDGQAPAHSIWFTVPGTDTEPAATVQYEPAGTDTNNNAELLGHVQCAKQKNKSIEARIEGRATSKSTAC